MRPSSKYNQATCRRGVAIVEFAIALPIVLLIFVGMIEISRILLLQHTADTAAYEGARSGMVPGATSDEASKAAQLLLAAAGLKSSSITVTPTLIIENTPLITVRVEIPIAPNAWISPKWFADSFVASEITLFCERPPMIQLTGVPTMKSKSSKIKGNKAAL